MSEQGRVRIRGHRKFLQVGNTLHRHLGGTEVRVVLEVLHHCDYGTGEGAMPSIRTIAGALGLGRSAVAEAIGSLKRRGVIEAAPRWRADGGRTSSEYVVDPYWTPGAALGAAPDVSDTDTPPVRFPGPPPSGNPDGAPSGFPDTVTNEPVVTHEPEDLSAAARGTSPARSQPERAPTGAAAAASPEEPSAHHQPPGATDATRNLVAQLRQALPVTAWTGVNGAWHSRAARALATHGPERLLAAARAGHPPRHASALLARWDDLDAAPAPDERRMGRCPEHGLAVPVGSVCSSCRAEHLAGQRAAPTPVGGSA